MNTEDMVDQPHLHKWELGCTETIEESWSHPKIYILLVCHECKKFKREIYQEVDEKDNTTS